MTAISGPRASRAPIRVPGLDRPHRIHEARRARGPPRRPHRSTGHDSAADVVARDGEHRAAVALDQGLKRSLVTGPQPGEELDSWALAVRSFSGASLTRRPT